MLSPLQILNLRRAPIAGAPQAASEVPDQNFEADSGDRFIDTAQFFQGVGLQFSVFGPEGVVVGPLTGQLVIPTDMAWRSAEVTVTARNANGTASQTFRVFVEAVGEPPRVVAQIPDQVFETGSRDHVLETAPYFEGEELRYSVSGSSRASINATTGRLTYSTGSQVSDSSVTVLAANNHGSVSQTFRVAVEAAGEPPRLVTQIPDQVFETGSGDQVVETAFYFDGEELQYSVSGSSRVSINTTSGRLTYSTGLQASDSGVTVSVANNFGSVSQTFRVVVEAVGEPPRAVAEIPDQVFKAASGDQVVETAPYFEGEDLNYGVSGSSLASINAHTGRLIYSTESQASDSGVTVSVANNFGSVSQTFRVIVQAVDNPPRVVAQIQDLIFDIYSGDQEIETAPYFEGERLWFSVNGPEGVTIDGATGRLSIDTGQEWASGTITVIAQNSGGSAASSFQITLEREDAGTEPDYTPAATELRTSVEKDGVTFFFNEPAQVGKYCTGDWFVVIHPGLKLTATDPACRKVLSTEDSHGLASTGLSLVNRFIHGLQINPSDADKNGFDSFAGQNPSGNVVRTHRGVSARLSVPAGAGVFQAAWSPALNMDPAFIMDNDAVSNPAHALTEPRGPLPLDQRMSLVKAISNPTPGSYARNGQSMLVSLTVVDNVPPAGSFRPPVAGPFVDIPLTWTEANIQSWLENLPRLNFTNQYWNRTISPTGDAAFWAQMGEDARRCWQTWGPRSTPIRNVTPLYQTDGGSNAYRREIADYLGKMLHALIADCDWEHKRDIAIGLIQIGIDQAAAPHYYNNGTAETISGATSWDDGRLAPTALAAAALPDSEWIEQAIDLPRLQLYYPLMRGSAWEDSRAYHTVKAENTFDPPLPLPQGSAQTVGVWDWIDPTPDLSPSGPVPGMLGHGITNGRGGRPETSGYLPGSNGVAYSEINLIAMARTAMPAWLIPGVFEAYKDNGALRFLDRHYATDPLPAPQQTVLSRFWQEIRSNPNLEAFVVKTPNRLWDSPTVEGFGTALIVDVPPHAGDNGSPITGCDLRYRPISITFDSKGENTGESTLGPWVEVEDITPNADGQYIVSPEPTGGLLENTYYCVQIRYNNAIGKGPWSRTHRSAWNTTNETWGSGGRMFSAQAFGQTGAQLALAAPEFVIPPQIESYFLAGAKARVPIINPPRDGANYTGFPFPTPSFQWRLDGVDIPGATTQEIEIPSDSAGKVLSCQVTLTNSEGSDAETIEGATVSASVPSTGYAPSLMSVSGNVRFGRVDGVNIFSTAATRSGTVSFFFGGRHGSSAAIISSNRFEVIVHANGVVSVSISNGLAGTRGYMEFPGPQPNIAHWYLIAIDTTISAEHDRVKLWVRPAGSAYPERRVMPSGIRDWSGGTGSFQFNEDWRMGTANGHWLFPSDPEDQSFITGDVFMERGVARSPEDFIAENGQYRDPATVGAPFLLMGSTMSADDWNEGRNLGSSANRLPSIGGGGEFGALD